MTSPARPPLPPLHHYEVRGDVNAGEYQVVICATCDARLVELIVRLVEDAGSMDTTVVIRADAGHTRIVGE